MRVDKDFVFAAVADERRRIAVLIEGLDDAQLATASLCTGWGTPTINLINALAGPPAPSLASNSVAITAESCANGAVDPNETVTINFGLKNVGGAPTTNGMALTTRMAVAAIAARPAP